MKNNQPVAISAPGKLMLFGEHAVVYGYPCIATTVGARIHVSASITDGGMFLLNAPEVGVLAYTKSMADVGKGNIPKEVRYIESALQHFLQRFPVQNGISIQTHADFSSKVGFGSSSATVVSALCAFIKIFNVKISEKELFTAARDVVSSVQGRASGFDVAAAIWGNTIFFSKNGDVIEPLSVLSVPLVIGYTGEKADTKTLVDMVNQKLQKYPQKVDRIFQAIEKIVIEAKERIGSGDWERVGKLMDFNQEYLRDIGVSSEKLETLISAAKKSGALGAKLSGAGGGDCMIALYPDGNRGKQKIAQAITEAGGTVIDVAISVIGVCAEEGKQV
jgi:mevalonate kinase